MDTPVWSSHIVIIGYLTIFGLVKAPLQAVGIYGSIYWVVKGRRFNFEILSMKREQDMLSSLDTDEASLING